MNKKMSKRQRDIKSKLMAAVAMLLVSSIMMVSTTYAWFTLSTAPEVTGITTSVGANGNLEMALMPENALSGEAGEGFGITSQSGDSMEVKAKTLANITWGNLVDLSDESYGLTKIKLYPAALNATTGTDAQGNPTMTLGASYLQTPEYGSDGRVSALVKNSVTGIYKDAAFNTSDLMGVRAVGNASGMTARQILYRNALQEGSTNTTQAANKATNSLNQRGSKLASIAIKHGTSGGSDTYGKADVETLRGMITDLNEIMGYIEKAYMKYVEAYVYSASGLAQTADGDLLAEGFAGKAATATTIDALLALVTSDAGTVVVPESAKTPIDKFNGTADTDGTKDKVEEADNALKVLEATLATNADATFTWSEISTALTPLLETGSLKVNGYTVEEVKSKTDEFAQAVLDQGGVNVTMPSGSGVYSDIADHAGDYQSAIVIEKIEYGGASFTNMKARMSTKSTVPATYLPALHTAATKAGAPSADGSSGAAPITDMYGYVIDLAFRTNASDSKLKLQTTPAGRIYGTEDSAETMGHGATMTFDSTVATFTVDNVKNLMETIRIVFFEPVSKNVLATAKLDMLDESVSTVGTAVTAPIKLYKTVDGAVTNYVEAGEGVTATHYYNTTSATYVAGTPTYIVDPDGDGTTYRLATGDETATHVQLVAPSEDGNNKGEYAEVKFVAETTDAGTTSTQWLEGDNAVITALNQNTAHAVSVLVYMDGETVTNSHVAAVANTSAVGTMNLQFSSTANLVPMEYTALMNQGGSALQGTKLTAITVNGADGSALTGVTAAGAFEEGGKVTIKVTGAESISGVSVGGTALETSAYTVSGDTVTFTKADIAADTAIVITATAAASEPTP